MITTLATGFPSTTVWFGFVTVVGLTGVITAAGLEFGSFGFDPFAFSSTSVTPSPSSSVSVTSGSPSLSVSLCTVISTVLVVFEPSGFVTTTGISNFLVSSAGPQSVIFGLPVIVNTPGTESSTISPDGTFVLSIFAFESILSGFIFTFFIGFLSTTVCS